MNLALTMPNMVFARLMLCRVRPVSSSHIRVLPTMSHYRLGLNIAAIQASVVLTRRLTFARRPSLMPTVTVVCRRTHNHQRA